MATVSFSQLVSQTLSSAETALGKTQLIWLMCLSETLCVLCQAEMVCRVIEDMKGGVLGNN